MDRAPAALDAREWDPWACRAQWHVIGAERFEVGEVMRTPWPADPAFPVVETVCVAVFPSWSVWRVTRGAKDLPAGSFVACL